MERLWLLDDTYKKDLIFCCERKGFDLVLKADDDLLESLYGGLPPPDPKKAHSCARHLYGGLTCGNLLSNFVKSSFLPASVLWVRLALPLLQSFETRQDEALAVKIKEFGAVFDARGRRLKCEDGSICTCKFSSR